MVYALEEEQLLSLLKQAYEQGVYGHFDLAQSVAESMLESCKDRQLTNPYYKPDYLDSPLDMPLQLEELETEGARLDPVMVENIFPATRVEGGFMTESDYRGHNYPPQPQDAEWETVTIPGGNPGIQIMASSGNRIELVDHPVESETPNSNQEGFHWEPYSLAGGNMIREVNNEQESRKRLRG